MAIFISRLRVTALVIVMLISTLVHAGEFLKPDEAFVLSSTSDGELSWQIAPHYYLYKDRIKVTKNGQPVGMTWLTMSESKDDPNFGLVEVFHDTLSVKVNDVAPKEGVEQYRVEYQGCSEDGLCYPPQNQTVSLSITRATAQSDIMGERAQIIKPKELVSEEQGLMASLINENIWIMLLTFFALGLGLSLTPCVLPMVPILGGIIAGQSGELSTRKGFMLALSYVLGMSITYSLAGVLVGLFGAQLNLQAAMQTPWILTFFGIVFVALAFSMFGFYEIQLPDRLRNKMDSVGASMKGGQLFGVAAMGAVSALVVSPCVSAPLAGALLYISTTGDAWLGGVVLFVLSLGMGVPLLLMGIGGGRFVPKAGMWMQQVKAFFGVVLLGVAISLVSRFLPLAISVSLWAVLLFAYGCYVLPNTLKTGWSRMQLAFSSLILLYSISIGSSVLAGAPNLIEPLAYQVKIGSAQTQVHQPLFSRYDKMETIHQQLDQAAQQGMPAVLDFYADWCTACSTMEKEVFDQPSVLKLADQFAFLQLDMTDNTDVQQAYMKELGIFGPPALVFFNRDGSISQISQGELTESDMLEKLAQVR